MSAPEGLVNPARRALMLASAAAVAAPAALHAQDSDTAADAPFDFETVVGLARRRAEEGSGVPERQELDGVFADLSYDDYRAIRPRPEARLWHGEGLGFEIDLLPPGSIYSDRVAVYVVEDGAPRPQPFDAGTLDFGTERFDPPNGRASAGDGEGLNWTGFRLRAPLNRPDVFDEFAVFQGASFFRGVGRDGLFGTSARGLAIDTGAPEGEEFPVFTAFWIFKPEPNASELRFCALLESESVTGAYAFTVRPGADTRTDVRAAVFPRREIANLGIAPLTSMYYFGPKERGDVDDYRDAVHDSSGLQMLTGSRERVWRPLTNPAGLQLSTFVDENPQGFGLAQRPRAFGEYQDAEARYDRRPSAWVAPGNDWGRGGVVLVEIPTDSEFNDNIVAFWRPDTPLEAGSEHRFSYQLYWSPLPPDEAPVARAGTTRAGEGLGGDGSRLMVIDFHLGEHGAGALKPEAESNGGELVSATLYPLPDPGRARVALRFVPPDEGGVEFRLRLVQREGGEAASETWLYRWTPT